MEQNLYQISCNCQHNWIENNEVLKFQKISGKHSNVKKQIKSVFATVCNTYCIICRKIQMIFFDNSKKLVTVKVDLWRCKIEFMIPLRTVRLF